MSGGFNVGGLITGLDTNNLIRQLLEIERAPITRLQQRIRGLESEQTAVSDLRSQLLTLRNRVQDFRLSDRFNRFAATVPEGATLEASVTGANPATGTYSVEVLQLATATVANGGRLGAAINPGAPLASSGIATSVDAGAFTVNGVGFNLDPNTQSLNDILNSINASGAGVTATYDAVTDTVTFENAAPGDTSLINFGADTDTSNFLAAIGVKSAYQSTGAGGSTQVTSARHLGSVDPSQILNAISFNNGAVTGGTFFINGVSITIDPAADTLDDVVSRINSSDAGVTASVDTTTDSLRVVSDQQGSRTIRFTAGTSNFLNVAGLTTATQTAGADAQYRIDGGDVITVNSNTVQDVIPGVTLKFRELGTTAVTVDVDSDAIVEDVQGFVDAFNESVKNIRSLTGAEGTLRGDIGLRSIESFLRSVVFQTVGGAGDYVSLLDIGISTGQTFDPKGNQLLAFDEDKFRAALADDRAGVSTLFANDAENGVADLLFPYLDETTGLTGYLNQRSRAGGFIDNQIDNIDRQIERIEQRVAVREQRLRAQFAQLEQFSSNYQVQGGFLGGISNGLQQLS